MLIQRISAAAFALVFLLGSGAGAQQRQMENLGRGMVAMPQEDGKVYVGWRLLGTDPAALSFNLYRAAGDGGKPVRLNKAPLTTSTNFVDATADLSRANRYFVRPVLNGKEQAASAPFALPAHASAKPYLSIPLQTPEGYTPNDAAVGDLDGDGEYEIVVKQEMRGRDNSQAGVTPGTTKLEAYKQDGTFLWRIDLGKNIREGAHYTPFIVYDLNGDGSAEIAVRTSEETIDGTGAKIGDTNGDERTDYVNPETGYILEGPEFISVYDGRTGREVARADYIARGKVTDWGDGYGNRVDRFLMGVAYVDGKRPSLILSRGYYALTKLEAWNWRDGRLTRAWAFSSGDPGNAAYGGQGNHSLTVGDVDGDGKDEIVYGAMTVDDNGKGLYTTGIGHGDALHLSDLDPGLPGLEVFHIQERFADAGANFRDARTGKVLWKRPSVTASGKGQGPGRGLALDVDPRYPGFECWVAGAGITGMFDCKGNRIAEKTPSVNMGVYWDDDLLSEILDGTAIDKWDWASSRTVRLLDTRAHGCASNNGTKANPALSADLLGDWREEVIWRTEDNRALRIFTTTIPSSRRFYTFMHDPVYRLSVAWQNVGYNQPPHTGFYFGHGMTAAPPRPRIFTAVPTVKAKR